jgi:hypothetical protein
MREATRWEYRYFRSPEELEWRLEVANELWDRAGREAANFYLRFWAYCLARIPMVHARANEGIDVSFMRPQRAILPDLQTHCPEILDDLRTIFAGAQALESTELECSLEAICQFREAALHLLSEKGIELEDLRIWTPHETLER